jgi:chromosome segregation ATPase
MTRLSEALLTHAATGGVSALSAWALLRGKRVEQTGEQRVAEISAEPSFAQQLLEALDRLDKERQLVAQLRIDLAAVTSERDALSEQVEALSGRLDETTRRLGELNEQFSALARSVQTQIPRAGAEARVNLTPGRRGVGEGAPS